MSIRVLITGTAGLLGKAITSTSPDCVDLYRTYFSALPVLPGDTFGYRMMDVRDKMQIVRAFEWANPDVVIHAAAVGSVDYCEKHRDEVWKVNVGGTQNIGDLCLHYEAKMIYVSSNAVFDGKNPPYTEDAPVNPVNSYGQLKVEAERWVKSSGLEYAIIRPILMYGWPSPGERQNWATTWVKNLSEGKQVKVVSDIWSKPLYAKNCAEAIWATVLQGKSGIYHVAGADYVTLYGFALAVAKVFGLDESLIEPVRSSYFRSIAPRPRDTSFDTTKMEEQLGIESIGLTDGLTQMKLEAAS